MTRYITPEEFQVGDVIRTEAPKGKAILLDSGNELIASEWVYKGQMSNSTIPLDNDNTYILLERPVPPEPPKHYKVPEEDFRKFYSWFMNDDRMDSYSETVVSDFLDAMFAGGKHEETL